MSTGIRRFITALGIAIIAIWLLIGRSQSAVTIPEIAAESPPGPTTGQAIALSPRHARD